MKTEIRLTAALMVLLLTSFTPSCDSSSENNETSLSYLTSELDRNLNPGASPDEKSALIAGNTDFALDMFAQLTDSDECHIFLRELGVRIFKIGDRPRFFYSCR